MLSKFLSLLVVVFLSASVQAQTKTVPLSSGQAEPTLCVYQPDPLVRPTGTSVVICGSDQTDALEKTLLSELSKTGCVGFMLKGKQSTPTPADLTKAFQNIQANATEYQIRKERLGLLGLGVSSQLGADDEPFAFIGLIDPVTLPKLKKLSAPVFIEASKDNTTAMIRFYTKSKKRGAHIDLHLHEQAMQDSVKATQWIDWLGSLGYMKPLSEDKTEALKNKEAWDNLAKYYDDRLHKDWPWLARYEEDNAKLGSPIAGENRVVFMGDSITEGWISSDPDFFQTHKYINRGIGGQTTPQMLVRFRQDVTSLHPKVVIILAGINDIAENTGPSKIENVAGNLFTMCEIAKVHGCKPILCSVLPAAAFPWRQGIDPIPPILKLNALLKEYAGSNRLTYVDCYSAVVAEDKGMKKDLAKDGVHPSLAGYKVMEPLVQAAIDKALVE